MAGKKRAAEDSPASPTRASTRRGTKAAKVSSDGEHSSPAAVTKKPASSASAAGASSKKKAAAGPKTTVPTTAHFKDHALPLHIHVTHTPPTSEVPGSAADPTPNMSTDPGFVASITLAPSVFSTGSFGWKGSRRVPVELQNAEGKKESVMVMMSFNATVVGSKPSAAKAKKPKSKSKKKKDDDSDDDDDDLDDDDE